MPCAACENVKMRLTRDSAPAEPEKHFVLFETFFFFLKI